MDRLRKAALLTRMPKPPRAEKRQPIEVSLRRRDESMSRKSLLSGLTRGQSLPRRVPQGEGGLATRGPVGGPLSASAMVASTPSVPASSVSIQS